MIPPHSAGDHFLIALPDIWSAANRNSTITQCGIYFVERYRHHDTATERWQLLPESATWLKRWHRRTAPPALPAVQSLTSYTVCNTLSIKRERGLRLPPLPPSRASTPPSPHSCSLWDEAGLGWTSAGGTSGLLHAFSQSQVRLLFLRFPYGQINYTF